MLLFFSFSSSLFLLLLLAFSIRHSFVALTMLSLRNWASSINTLSNETRECPRTYKRWKGEYPVSSNLLLTNIPYTLCMNLLPGLSSDGIVLCMLHAGTLFCFLSHLFILQFHSGWWNCVVLWFITVSLCLFDIYYSCGYILSNRWCKLALD